MLRYCKKKKKLNCTVIDTMGFKELKLKKKKSQFVIVAGILGYKV